MAYKFTTHTIPLDAAGGEGFTVEIKDPKALPWGTMKKLSTGNASAEETEGILTKLIVNWNLEDDEGKKLPIPKDDLSVFDEVPTGIIVHIVQQATGLLDVPKP